MSAVKEIGKQRRYVFAILVLMLGIVMLAKAPGAGNSSANSAGSTGTVAGKQAGPQIAMPGGGGASGSAASFSQATGQPGSVVVGHSLKNDVSPPLRDIKPLAPVKGQGEGPENRALPVVHKNEHINDPVVQNWFGPLAIPTTIANFEGVNNLNGVYPPDTQGDVGPNHYVQWVNLSFQIWNKSGTSLLGPVAGNTLWAGFGGPCQTSNSGDPITLYDPIADRWMMSQFTTAAPYYQCIAVSITPDPTGTWNRYAFQLSTNLLNDYPHFGVWPDGYYMTANRFLNGSSYDSPAAYAFDRVAMLAGTPATFQLFNPGNYFFAILPSDLDGPTLPPAGAPNYFATTAGTSNTLRVWKFHVDWTTPANSTFTGPVNVITAPFDPNLCGGSRNCVPQPSTAVGLDAQGDKPLYRLAYRNFGDHESIVTNQGVDVDGADHVGIRWYELRDPGGRPFIFQQGTYAPDALHRWTGSAAMDKDGDIALGYSASSSTSFPSVRYTGRLASDPLGTMPQGEGVIMQGTGSQTGTANRWGDYSMMAVDPSDDCTFWFTSEYIQTTGGANWRTRVGSFRFPSCGGPTPTGTPPTATNTPSPFPTATSTPPACADYTNTTSTGATIVPGTVDLGVHCDDCTTYITLPFPVKLYDRTFTNAYVSSNGNLQLNSSDNAFGNACLPVSIFEYTISLYWDDLDTRTTNPGDGVFTSVTGSSPSQVFNVEWRSHILATGGVANFELRLFEGSPNFEMIYGTVGQPGTGQTVGIQRDRVTFSQFSCDSAGLSSGLKITWNAPECYSFTPTPTFTPTNTPTNTATSTPLVTATNTPGPCITITFTDVHVEDYFYEPVQYLFCHGAISGYGDNTFRPGNLTTRGQLSKIVAIAEGWATYIPSSPTFRDVDTSNAFYQYIETAYHQGVISGYDCGSGCLEFRPGNNVTRGQLAKIVVLAEAWTPYEPPTPTFQDVTTSNPFYTNIETAYSKGIISGYDCGSGCLEFRPGNNATRGQISKIVYLAVTAPGE